jgi:hypothetical protein
MNAPLITVSLHTLAHARAGDKGNRLNISLICHHPASYPFLVEQVNEKAVSEIFKCRNPTSIKRYDLPNLHAFNFVLDEVLEGGVNNSLMLDKHGKGLSYLLLSLKVKIPKEIVLNAQNNLGTTS